MSTGKSLSLYTMSLSLPLYGQGLSSERTSKAAQAQVGNIMILSTHHWPTVDTRTIYCRHGRTQAADVLPITPQLSLSDLSLPGLLFSSYSVAFQASMLAPSLCVGVHGLERRILLATEIFLEKKKKKNTLQKRSTLTISLCLPLSLLHFPLCLSSITLNTLLIGSRNALLSQPSRPSDPQSLSLVPTSPYSYRP